MFSGLAALAVEWHLRAQSAQTEADRQLAQHDGAARARARELRDLAKALNGLPVDVQVYFREAVQCLEHQLTRAAVVLSWSGFLHTASNYLYTHHLPALRARYTSWALGSFEEMMEIKESQLLEAMRQMQMIKAADKRVFDGQLAKRNQCAHPTLYKPSLNNAIGYVDEMIHQTIRFL